MKGSTFNFFFYCVTYLFCCVRFEKNELERLKNALNLPDFYRCEQGTKATGMEALLIMLRRLSFPNRWCDLVSLFGRAEPELSSIFNLVSHEYMCKPHSKINIACCTYCFSR